MIFDERNSEESSETDMKVMMEWDKQISNICNEVRSYLGNCNSFFCFISWNITCLHVDYNNSFFHRHFCIVVKLFLRFLM